MLSNSGTLYASKEDLYDEFFLPPVTKFDPDREERYLRWVLGEAPDPARPLRPRHTEE